MECPSCHLPSASDLLQGVPAQSRWIRLVMFTLGGGLEVAVLIVEIGFLCGLSNWREWDLA